MPPAGLPRGRLQESPRGVGSEADRHRDQESAPFGLTCHLAQGPLTTRLRRRVAMQSDVEDQICQDDVNDATGCQPDSGHHPEPTAARSLC